MISQSRHVCICQFWRQVCLSCCPSDNSKPRILGSYPALCKKKIASFLCHTVLSHVASMAPTHPSTLPHKQHNFQKKKLLNKKSMV